MVREPVACGVDVGSTNLKIVAITRDGRVIARQRLSTPRISAFDPSINAESILDAVETMLIQALGSKYVADAISVAGMGEDGVPMIKCDTSKALALAWFDSRRTAALQDIPQNIRALATKTLTGLNFDAARSLVGWNWQRQNCLGWNSASHWVTLTDYLSCRWSADIFMSDSLAARTSAWNPWTREWIESIVKATLGTIELPPVVKSGTVIGSMKSHKLIDAGVATGNTMLVAGGHDHPVASSAINRLVNEAVLDSMGTAEVISGQSSVMPPPGQLSDYSVSPGIGGGIATLLSVFELARNIRWAKSDSPEISMAMDELIAGKLSISELDHDLRGAFMIGTEGGNNPGWAEKSTLLSNEEKAKAVLISCVDASVDSICAISQFSGTSREIYATGGWTRSNGWMNIKSQILGRDLRIIPEPEVTAVGAALLAADALQWEVDSAVALGF